MGRRDFFLTVDVFRRVPGDRAAREVRVRNVPSKHLPGRDVVHGHNSRSVESGALGGELNDVCAEFVVRSERK